MEYVPSRVAAKKLGLHPNTLRKWADAGKINHVKMASGQRRYDIETFLGEASPAETICYCRVSSYKQKDDLRRQVAFMSEQFPAARIIKDIGSGINFKRKGLKAVLDSALDGHKLTVVVAHKDRLCRFGFDLIQWLIERSGGEVLVLNESKLSPEAELTQDLLTILHVFSCRMHGLRSYKDKISAAFAYKTTEKDIQTMDGC
jgi:predicted site-specific integrase-resolvase